MVAADSRTREPTRSGRARSRVGSSGHQTRPRRHGAFHVATQDPALVGEGEDEARAEQDHARRRCRSRTGSARSPSRTCSRHRVGGVDRAAAGRDPDEVEQLQRADDRQEHRDPERRPEQRQGHVADRLPARRAVDRRRLLELARDALQTGQQQDHVEPEVLPRDDEEQGEQDGVGSASHGW